MRSRIVPTITSALVVMAVAAAAAPAAASDVADAERDLEKAADRVQSVSGLVDDAVADREAVEAQLAGSIARASDLAAALSTVGVSLDRLAGQVSHADVELAGIQEELEAQAVDSYMTLVSSPSLALAVSESVEQAMIASSAVEQVVNRGRMQATELFVKRRGLEELQAIYLAQQAEYAQLKAEMDAEVEHLVALYEQADAEVARAVRRQQQADADYRAALSAVDLARARQAESDRQESRNPPSTTTTTTIPSSPTSPTTTPPAPTTTVPPDGGSWSFPAHIERWRPLVQQFFPTNRVDEALAIMRCESNGDPDAYNPFTGASGLFQFLPSTWATTAPRAGYPDASPFDPEANTASAAWLANRYAELGEDYWRAWSCRRVLD